MIHMLLTKKEKQMNEVIWHAYSIFYEFSSHMQWRFICKMPIILSKFKCLLFYWNVCQYVVPYSITRSVVNTEGTVSLITDVFPYAIVCVSVADMYPVHGSSYASHHFLCSYCSCTFFFLCRWFNSIILVLWLLKIIVLVSNTRYGTRNWIFLWI